MYNNFKNSEGYADPTAGYAWMKMIKEDRMKRRKRQKNVKRPVVYICSRYAGNTERNSAKARKYCAFAVRRGYIPFAPHLLFPQFLNDRDKHDRKLALDFGLQFIDRCDELWVFGKEMSAGMKGEKDKAQLKRMVIRYFNENCTEVKEL